MQISPDIEKNVENFEEQLKGCADIKKHTFYIGKDFSTKCYVAYIEVTVSNVAFCESVIGKLICMLEETKEEQLYECLNKNGCGFLDLSEHETIEETISGMMTGDAVLFVDGMQTSFQIAVKGYPGMGVTENTNEPNVRGSKEAFSDSVKVNTALIRKRVRSEGLKVKEIKEGVRSNTTVALVYIEEIVKEGLVETIEKKLDEYEIDGVFDSGMLIQLMENSKYSPFPQYQATERPDRAAMAVLEGRVVLLVDNSPMAVLLPANYHSFFVTTDDYYNRWEIATMERIIRYIASILAMFLPALYLSVVKFHSQVVPTTLLLTFASSRKGVPFSPFGEILIMEIAFELLREAGVRIPGSLGKSIGIVGGLIVGQATVDAGLVSPIVVIIVALTALASFCVPNEEFGSAYRLIKFGMLFVSAFLGIYGVILGVIVLLLHLSDLTSMGYPFLLVKGGFKKNLFGGMESMIRKPSDEITLRSIYANEKEKVRLAKKSSKIKEDEINE